MSLASIFEAFHRAMAIYALRDTKTLSRRLSRYNHHMSKARLLALTGSPITAATGVHYE
ncbi:hypothetical protein HZF02_10065 [Pseudomonas yamanorum]|nr:hypothetical protein HZF02_10065 [Pseudomonas yamanorum]